MVKTVNPQSGKRRRGRPRKLVGGQQEKVESEGQTGSPQSGKRRRGRPRKLIGGNQGSAKTRGSSSEKANLTTDSGKKVSPKRGKRTQAGPLLKPTAGDPPQTRPQRDRSQVAVQGTRQSARLKNQPRRA